MVHTKARIESHLKLNHELDLWTYYNYWLRPAHILETNETGYQSENVTRPTEISAEKQDEREENENNSEGVPVELKPEERQAIEKAVNDDIVGPENSGKTDVIPGLSPEKLPTEIPGVSTDPRSKSPSVIPGLSPETKSKYPSVIPGLSPEPKSKSPRVIPGLSPDPKPKAASKLRSRFQAVLTAMRTKSVEKPTVKSESNPEPSTSEPTQENAAPIQTTKDNTPSPEKVSSGKVPNPNTKENLTVVSGFDRYGDCDKNML